MSSILSAVAQFRIPDTLRNWPWARQLNPYYLECKVESASWCESFNAFSGKAQEAFNLCDFNLLASLAYPTHSKAGLRVACDLMNLFFMIDEHSDIVDANSARLQAEIVMDALKNPHTPRPHGEWVGGEITRQFWINAIKATNTTQVSQQRFIDRFQLYMNDVVEQAKDRSSNQIRTLNTYLEMRRNTIGMKPSLVIFEIENLPDEVLAHPAIVALTNLCIDMVSVGNDLYSYDVEQARGDDGHNIVTIVMHELEKDLEGTLDWISEYHDNLVSQFLDIFHSLPSWGDSIDRDVAKYIDGLGHWVRGNESWSFEGERYFGKQGLEIQRSRVVKLSPKQPSYPDDSTDDV